MVGVETYWDYRNPHLWMEKVGRTQLPPVIVTAAINGGFHAVSYTHLTLPTSDLV